MSVFTRIAEWWEGFKTEFKTEERVEQKVDRRDIENIDEDLDYDRGVARGRQKEEERKRKSLEKSIKSDKQKNVSAALNKQKEELRKKSYENATSLRKLFDIADKSEVTLTSRDMNTEFGTFQDIWILDDGRLAFCVEEEDTPLTTGRTTADILRNPSGLRNEVKNELMVLSVNQKGQPVETPEGQKVPDVIMGPDGELTFTESYQEQYLDKVGDLKAQLGQLRSRESAKEKAMVSMSSKLDDLERDLEVASSLEDSTRESLDRRIEEMKNMTKEFDSMQRSQARIANHKTMSEEMVGEVIGKRQEFLDEFTEKIDQDELDLKNDQIRRIANLASDLMNDMADGSPEKQQGMNVADQMGQIMQQQDSNQGGEVESGELE